jgi:site-specific DNA-methyltransferase (adenine-specific)
MGHQLICGDALSVIPTLGHYTVAIADPPDNIGLGYKAYKDRKTADEYRDFFYRLMQEMVSHADTSWISFNSKWVFMAASLVEQLQTWWGKGDTSLEAKLFIQSFTFGQNCKNDCGNGYRPLLRLRWPDASLYPDAIKVPSWRQQHGDKRAAAGGRVPLDHWDEFPRITGNCRERRPHHPTQLREGLVRRCIDLSSKAGDSVLDIFSGTGTVLRAAKHDRVITSIELDPFYCEKIAEEHGLGIEKAAA